MRKILIQNTLIIFILYVIVLSISLTVFINKNITDTYNSKNKEIASQINYNFNSYFDTIINTSNTTVDKLQKEQSNSSIEDLFELTVNVKTDIKGIALYDNFNNLYVKSSLFSLPDEEELNKLSSQAKLDSSIYIFSTPYGTLSSDSGCYIVREVKYYNVLGTIQTGYLFVDFNFSKIIELSEACDLGENGHIDIVDNQNNVVYSSGDIFLQDKDIIEKTILGETNTTIDSNRYYVNIDTCSSTPWRIAIFSNSNELHNQLVFSIFSMLGLGVLAIAVGFFITFKLSKIISSPLNELSKKMANIEKSHDLVHIKIENNDLDEIKSLTSSFNSMVDQIRSLMEEIYKRQDDLRVSELKSLQNQINPHFLYNTLDSIIYLSETNQNEKSIEMTVALARLFRISISKGKMIIPIKQEIEHANNYLVIQSIRYAGAFEYKFEIDENIGKYSTIKLILQPLIENAIYHGLKNRVDKGLLLIKGYFVEDKICFEIIDNGYGIAEDKLQDILDSFKKHDPGVGVGIVNVYRRLKLYFGDKATLDIISELDEGTTIKILIPREVEMNEKKIII